MFAFPQFWHVYRAGGLSERYTTAVKKANLILANISALVQDTEKSHLDYYIQIRSKDRNLSGVWCTSRVSKITRGTESCNVKRGWTSLALFSFAKWCALVYQGGDGRENGKETSKQEEELFMVEDNASMAVMHWEPASLPNSKALFRVGSLAFSIVLGGTRIPAQTKVRHFWQCSAKTKKPFQLRSLFMSFCSWSTELFTLLISLLTDSVQYKPGY